MLKKLAYISIGIAIIALKKAASLLQPDRAESGAPAPGATTAPQATAVPQTSVPAVTPVAEPVPKPEVKSTPVPYTLGADDLTSIDGIGPTYARRLQAAGITSYAELAKRTAAELRDIAQVKGQSADTESWIAQAALLARR